MEDMEEKSIAAVFEFRLWNLRRFTGGSTGEESSSTSKLTRRQCPISSAKLLWMEARALLLTDIKEVNECSSLRDLSDGRSKAFAGDILRVVSFDEQRASSAERLRQFLLTSVMVKRLVRVANWFGQRV